MNRTSWAETRISDQQELEEVVLSETRFQHDSTWIYSMRLASLLDPLISLCLSATLVQPADILRSRHNLLGKRRPFAGSAHGVGVPAKENIKKEISRTTSINYINDRMLMFLIVMFYNILMNNYSSEIHHQLGPLLELENEDRGLSQGKRGSTKSYWCGVLNRGNEWWPSVQANVCSCIWILLFENRITKEHQIPSNESKAQYILKKEQRPSKVTGYLDPL